ncbi:MAG TPA: hypothetical protein VIY53_21140 [Acidobacteriaceae bacterium]
MKAGFLLMTAFLFQAAPQDVYTPLRLYSGPWTVTMRDTAPGQSRTDSLVNACSLVGRYFACQQTVNGKVSALVVFVPAATPGQYFTQNVMPDGSASGRGELTIAGAHWEYSSHDEENGKTTWYRTINDFTGNDRIHFESARSTDGKTWSVTLSGDEVRGTAAKP